MQKAAPNKKLINEVIPQNIQHPHMLIKLFSAQLDFPSLKSLDISCC